MTESRRRTLGLSLLLLLSWMLASWMRLRALPGATAGSDAIGQYMAGLSLGRGAWPTPPNPEGGHSLWLMVWPLTQAANSLDQLYTFRFILGASVAPMAAASAWLLGPVGLARWIAGALAGLLVALDPGLVDTLVIAFRGYGAPEMVGLATLCGALALRGHAWALVPAGLALLGAAGQHPMGTGMIVGGVCALPWFVQSLGRRRIEWSLGLCAVAALPRLWLIRNQSDCGQPALECLKGVALGSSEAEMSAEAMFTRAFHDRFTVELLGLWPLFVVGLLALGLPLISLTRRQLAPRIRLLAQPEHAQALIAFALGGVLGILLIGQSVDSLRPYHLRIAAVPLAVAAATGLARLWPLLCAVAVWVGIAWLNLNVLPPAPVSPQTFDRLASAIEPIEGPVWVDSVYLESPVGLDPAAVVLSAVLQGQDPNRFDVGLESSVVLLINGQPQSPELEEGSRELDRGEEWRMILFPDPVHARRWLSKQQEPAAPTGGAWDWLKVLHPIDADLATTAW